MNFKKGIKNISYSIIGQIVSLVLGIFIPRLVIVSYGSDINGLLSSIGQVMTYLALLEAGIGAATCQALYKPISKNDKEHINSILSATHIYYTRIGFVYLSLVIILAFVFPIVIHSSFSFWFVFALVIIQGMPGVISFLFQRKLRTLMEAEGDSYVLTNLGTISTTMTSAAKVVLLYLHVNIILIQILYCFANLIQMLFVLWYVKRHYPWLNLKQKPDFSALKTRKAAFLHQICGLVTSSTDVMVLAIFCDLGAASIYSVYNMIFNIVYNVLASISSGVLFILGQEYYKSRERYCTIINAYETYYMAGTSALMIVVYTLITPFLKLYTQGADIDYLNNSFPLLFLGVKTLESFRNAAVVTASVSGHFEETKWHAVFESIINLTISVICVQKFGMIGVLFGTIAAFLFRDCVALIYTNRTILQRSAWPSFRRIVINTILIAAMMWICRQINWYGDGYFVLLLKAIPLTLLSLTVFLVANSFSDLESYYFGKTLIISKIRSLFFGKE